MNTGFYKDLDTNFELACEMSEREFSHDEIMALLKAGNIPEKQIAALRLTKLSNIEEANALISNLTGCDGKIREAVALKINQLVFSDDKYIEIFSKNTAKIFADASIDINGNICRLVIDTVDKLKSQEVFMKDYIASIISFINEAFEALDAFIFRDKKYVINKQLFKLYWSLEALKLFIQEIPASTMFPILERAAEEKEYTIREKVAQILVQLSDKRFDGLKSKLINDENYYVKQVFKA